MNVIKNKTIVIIVSLIIVISLAGIIFTPKVNQKFTGMAANSYFGIAQINITCFGALNLYGKTIDFGTGYIQTGQSNCTLISNESKDANGCAGFNDLTGINNSFILRNEGSINMSITINSSSVYEPTNRSADAFLCDHTRATSNCTTTTPLYQYGVIPIGSACLGTAPIGWVDINQSLQYICDNMGFSADNNEIRVPIKIVIPRDSKKGGSNDTLQITGTGDDSGCTP